MNDNIHVMCPHCGTEFVIDENKRTAAGNLPDGDYFLVPKNDAKLEALNTLGIDISKFFRGSTSDTSSTSGASDEIEQSIKDGGYVEGKNLFRRWVMGQMFRALNSKEGYDRYYSMYNYEYGWKTLLDELKAQTKIKDQKELEMRQNFFNQETCVNMVSHYLRTIKRMLKNEKRRKCKGVEYIHIKQSGDWYITDIKDHLNEIKGFMDKTFINRRLSVKELYEAMKEFTSMKIKLFDVSRSSAWRNAFMGAGAYYTMDNLIKFHGCKIYKNMYTRELEPEIGYTLKYGQAYNTEQAQAILETAAKKYHYDYYALFRMMQTVITDNKYDYRTDPAIK